MSSIFGNHIQISIFGQSHSAAIGVVIDGLPAGERIDEEELQRFLARRAPGQSDLTTARREADQVRILSGLYRGCTCGAPLAAEIENRDVRSRDYEKIADIPRPGHADYTAHVKYGGWEDYRGGGHFSGRLTAPLCVAGGIAKQILDRRGIRIEAAIDEIGGVTYEDAAAGEDVTAGKDVMALPAAWTRMIATVREEGDSLGGIICCRISGMPAGVGSPMFDGLENRIAQAVFAIPAVKGLEFGAGFQAARM
nr:chorismate synthase [Clostridia bacterium]